MLQINEAKKERVSTLQTATVTFHNAAIVESV